MSPIILPSLLVGGVAVDRRVGNLDNWNRSLDFWRRAAGIYLTYKGTQLKALAASWSGVDNDTLEAEIWEPHHVWAGQEMYNLAVDLRGFYLKVGQFLGARSDFVPKPTAEKLSLLQDQVPPMPPEKVREVLQSELKVQDVNEVFEWIDLEKPLGSASISQVHKAKLNRNGHKNGNGNGRNRKRANGGQHKIEYVVKEGQDGWSVANFLGVPYDRIAAQNQDLDMENLKPGTVLQVYSNHPFYHLSGEQEASNFAGEAAAEAVKAGLTKDGVVAVKVQYPDAQQIMSADMKNVRMAAAFLQRTELKFDLVSAVNELDKQLQLEFDFTREARVMDTIEHNLRHLRAHIEIPTSIPGLVTKKVLVMKFMDGAPLASLKQKTAGLSEQQRMAASKRILGRVSEAYGHMILDKGLFQADGHPGNILVLKKGKIALLDYGQSKQLTDKERLGLAKLITALNRGDEEEVSRIMWDLGISTNEDDIKVRRKMAIGMFDTRGRVDPFDKDSPIKKVSIDGFPENLFFVLRVCQLLRGMKSNMNVQGFSSAIQWNDLAEEVIEREVNNNNNNNKNLQRQRRGLWARLFGAVFTRPAYL
eukprot:TRINITY_DN4403_c1_g1_i2.p1 TRINITY_DN4403_c1_g1~~TRINITY_DN4403_c1_g1_i2.p1  ORF type:complete len:589 (-),score=89.91 TRINITY_DN4403_c1_g1_i2:316-2082(-)